MLLAAILKLLLAGLVGRAAAGEAHAGILFRSGFCDQVGRLLWVKPTWGSAGESSMPPWLRLGDIEEEDEEEEGSEDPFAQDGAGSSGGGGGR